jgi:photosystem II stability/assembly factor-like uncharacterized protein
MKIRFFPLLLLLLFSLVAPIDAQDQEEWQNLTRPWLDKLPEYHPGSNPYSKRVSAVACDPNTGIVYLILPNKLGIWKSTDHGETWEKSEGQIYQGRNFGGFSHNMDFETGCLLVSALKTGFETKEGEKVIYKPRPVLTCDQGQTWHEVKVAPEGKGGRAGANDGWTWVAVDWSACPPQTMIAKEHHTKPGDIWITQDGGQTWTLTDQESRHLGVIDSNTFVLGKEDGIYRSTDGGSSWEKVSDYVPRPQIAVEYDGQIFWAAGNSVIVTEDGKDWETWGKELPDEIKFGPYLGRNAEEAMVVAGNKIYITRDAGTTWTEAADARGGMRSGYAWDPAENIIYFSAQNETGDVWKLSLP